MSADIRTLYTPSHWGEIFHNLDADEVMGGGSAGPGKSFVLLMDPIPRILHEFERQMSTYDGPHPLRPGMSEGHCLHLRRTRPMLNDTLVRAHRIFKAIDPAVHWDSDSTTFTFSCGYRYEFGHCKDPDSWLKYYSNGYDWIGFDELVQFTETQYDEISTRLRSSDPVLSRQLKIRSCSNPIVVKQATDDFIVEDPNWVRRRFVEPAGERTMGPPDAPPEERRMWWDAPVMERKIGEEEDGTPIVRTWMFFPATLEDNPDPKFIKTYRRQLLAQPAFRRSALLEGNWFVTANSHFAEVWDARVHTCDPFRIPKEWKVFRSMDWGYRQPGVIHWWAINPEQTLFCIKELTFKEKMDWQVAEMVKDIEAALKLDLVDGDRSRITGPCDTQLWEQRGSEKTKAATFADHGVFWRKADKRSRQRNFEFVTERLRDHENGRKEAGIVFFRSCRHIIRWIPSVQTDPHNSEQPIDAPGDHWGDSLGYACNFASHGWRGVPERSPKTNPWDSDSASPKTSSGNRMSYHG
jgi:hypothetical protein